MEVSKDSRLAKEVLRLRLQQLAVNEKYKAGMFKIPIHLALGHESIAAAVDSVMDDKDQLALSHRNIHYNLARAKSLRPILDEYLLQKEGIAHAELGSMNLAIPEKNVVYTSSILGNNLPVAAGIALAQKVLGTYGVIFVVTGDGAMEEGAFYESLLSMRSLGLRTVVIVENNEWSMHTKISERRSDVDLQNFAQALSLGYEKLSGNDPYYYRDRLKAIKKRVLETQIPIVLEVMITTLGGWHVEVEGNAEGRFIHPHAGALPKTFFTQKALLEESDSDPVFILRNYFSAEELDSFSKDITYNLNNEIGEI